MSKFLDESGLSYFWSKLKAMFALKADSASGANGVATRAAGIPYGEVDSTSTSTVFTATVPGITELKDGTVVMLRNGVVTSASGFTINVNGLGAKPVYNNMAAATRDTSIFNVNYTMLFVYDSDRVSGGCWICYRGYDANTNTIGYQLRTNSTVMNVSDTARYYKMYFMSADNTKWVPASVNSTNNATSARPVNQRPINPFGRIVYTSANTNYTAGSNLAATTIWDQYVFNLGYSFNRTGSALTMTVEAPVYLKCAPQTDGSAIMDADEPIVQTLPSTADGKIYIYLGVAYSATNIELVINHPVYYHDGTGIRQWSGAASSGGAVDSVNGQTGTVVLDATDVGALPDTTVIPTKTSDLTNDSGFITSTIEDNVTLKAAAATNSPCLIFQRGTLSDNYNDWQIQDRGGYLYFDERGQGSSAWTNRVMFNTTGGVVATTFSGQLSGTISSGTTATTQTSTDNSTKVATTAFVKSVLPTVPTNVSSFTNDSGYLTLSTLPIWDGTVQ